MRMRVVSAKSDVVVHHTIFQFESRNHAFPFRPVTVIHPLRRRAGYDLQQE
jgi:hypothetical protein